MPFFTSQQSTIPQTPYIKKPFVGRFLSFCQIDPSGMNLHQVALALCAFVAATAAATEFGARRRFNQLKGQAILIETDFEPEPQDSLVSSRVTRNAGDSEAAADSHYFQYANNPHKDHYDFGYKRGNHHHHIQRHEKAHPHAGHFTTKVTWGDKHGGHGEHYWDYNHGGHGDGHHDEAGEGSENVPKYLHFEPSEGRLKRFIREHGTSVVYLNENRM